MIRLYKTEHFIERNVMNCKTWKELEFFLEKQFEIVKHHNMEIKNGKE